jgi:predicted acetyltransferase
VSLLAAIEEFSAEGRGNPGDNSVIGRTIREQGPGWETPEGFAAYVDALLADRLEETPRPENFVPATELWYVEAEEFFGRLAIRHRLNEVLLEMGGHIGYDVRPTARLRGYATAMLREGLPRANALGIGPALVTCDLGNVGSRKVIESCGGELEDIRNGKRRYWVPTTLPTDLHFRDGKRRLHTVRAVAKLKISGVRRCG